MLKQEDNLQRRDKNRTSSNTRLQVKDLEYLRGRRQVVACALKGLYTTSARVGRRTSLWDKDLLPSMRKPSGLREIFENCPVPFIAPHEAHCFGRFAER